MRYWFLDQPKFGCGWRLTSSQQMNHIAFNGTWSGEHMPWKILTSTSHLKVMPSETVIFPALSESIPNAQECTLRVTAQSLKIRFTSALLKSFRCNKYWSFLAFLSSSMRNIVAIWFDLVRGSTAFKSSSTQRHCHPNQKNFSFGIRILFTV